MFSLFLEFKKSILYNQTWIFHDWTYNEAFQSTSLVSPSNLKISLVIYFLTIVIRLLQPRLISCYFSRISLPASHFLLCQCGKPSTFKMPAIRHVCWGKLQVLSRHSWRENICAVGGRVLGTGLPGSPVAHTPRDVIWNSVYQESIDGYIIALLHLPLEMGMLSVRPYSLK